ncbi:L-ribulose-5-phosphate 4-epimerase [Pseudogracilibacillus sp. SO30301A]|uniref:L-ribulose-5-phosphate 4-epimerase n=1 Tax=Pseudogracilibacillus sp. SO30301A TaxID=3098291 RepID=UPI00300DFB0F
MLNELKKRVCNLNKGLQKNNLVVMTSGNVSARDETTGYIVIKPSGMPYEQLTPEKMVVVDSEGNIIEGDVAPSVDTETHLFIYRKRKDIAGIVHTHSNYATSFAALGKSIPPVITSVADIFGGPVPVGPYVPVGGKEIGEAIVNHIGDSSGILMKQHGVFTIGKDPEGAFKSAVVLEDIAKTVHLALLKGTPEELTEEQIDKANQYYQHQYGQR